MDTSLDLNGKENTKSTAVMKNMVNVENDKPAATKTDLKEEEEDI